MEQMRGASVAKPARGIAAVVLALCVAVLPALAAAQDKPLTAYFRETWTTRQGLPHNQVNAIAQTPDGYLWFGTWEGLVRYNGLEFHAFDRSNTPALSIPENKGKLALFGGIKNARFRKQVTPGDVLTLHCELVEQRGPVGIGKASAYVDGKCAATAELTFVLTEANTEA